MRQFWFVLFFVLLAAGLWAQPQPFESRIGLSFPVDAQFSLQLEPGAYWVGGTQSIRADYKRGFLVRLDTIGQLLSQRYYGAPNNRQYFYAGIVDAGNIWVVGQEEVQGNSQAALWKLNSDGLLQQTYFYGDGFTDGAYDVAMVPSGGLVMGGFAQGSSSNMWDAKVWRLDTAGQIMWQRSLGGGDGNYCQAVLPTPDGGILAAGVSVTEARRLGIPGWGGLGFLWKLSATGQTEWLRYYGHQRERLAFLSLVSAGTNTYLLSGSVRELHPNSGIELNKPFWLTVNAQGDSLTDWVLNVPGEGIFYSATKHADALWVTGVLTREGQTTTDAILVKADTTGQARTYTTFGGPNNERVNSILALQTNNLLLTGLSAQPCDGCIYLVQTDADGCIDAGCMAAVGISEQELQKLAIQVYPNPVKSGAAIHIRLPEGSSEPLELQLVDLQGKIWRQWVLHEAQSTDPLFLNQLNSGMYLLYFRSRQQVAVAKLMVE